MSHIDEAAARVLSPLSTLLNKDLRSAESEALSPAERDVVQTIMEIIRRGEENETAISELRTHVSRLESENLDLMVRNRFLSEATAKDALTGLYSRWYVIEKIESEINRSLRNGLPMSLLMLDIDHFKRVNDTFGHSAGDQVLQLVGKLLKESCRVYDVPGRYGGEEFCVLLPNIDMQNTPTVAERIRARLASTEITVGGATLGVTASIGIAGLDASDVRAFISPAALIDRADRALYTAKHRGRNRCEIFDAGLFDIGAEDISH
jgi:diguanylate cyclase (GGDEF)-like protein